MSLLCNLLGHSWEKYELDPDKEEYTGHQKVCSRCEKFGDKVIV